VPFTDGRKIWLPRAWIRSVRGDSRPDAALVATLELARRLTRDTAAARPSGGRLARDLLWLAEGALADAELVRAWPGLGPDVAALRGQALRTRPDPARLRPTERAVEVWVRALLASSPERLESGLLGGVPSDAAGSTIAEFASERARALRDEGDGYRGCAPVPHWGRPARVAAATGDRAHVDATQRGPRPRRAASLGRPLDRRSRDEEEEGRPGPFVLPFSDPHLSVDDPGGLVRPPDQGHDEDLESLASELARLESLSVVRDGSTVREVLEDGGTPDSPSTPRDTVPQTTEPVWLYPEWDAARGAYRDPGCRVRELEAAAADGGWSQAVLADRTALRTRLRRQLEALRPRREYLRRQADGDDLDLGGWVDDWADRQAGRAPGGRVYTRERARRRDVAVTLLLDVSGSTESWISGRQRVIDVVKESALTLGEALATLRDRFSILAFSSQGAGDVRIRVLKRFDEPPGPISQRRIGALQPDAFTRLGGALRHATASLAREPARARLLLVLSDGKPQDEDGYEGAYGVEDVRQAAAEARLQGVRVFAVTVDREGPAYLPRLFGPHGYTVIWNAEALPDRLPHVYRRLTAGA
jgi:nitric oxide reductase NorD protein